MATRKIAILKDGNQESPRGSDGHLSADTVRSMSPSLRRGTTKKAAHNETAIAKFGEALGSLVKTRTFIQEAGPDQASFQCALDDAMAIVKTVSTYMLEEPPRKVPAGSQRV